MVMYGGYDGTIIVVHLYFGVWTECGHVKMRAEVMRIEEMAVCTMMIDRDAC